MEWCVCVWCVHARACGVRMHVRVCVRVGEGMCTIRSYVQWCYIEHTQWTTGTGGVCLQCAFTQPPVAGRSADR